MSGSFDTVDSFPALATLAPTLRFMAKRSTQKTDKGLEIPIPNKGDFDSAMKKVAPPAGRRRPDGKDRPPKQSG
jgi:hypothetical protein